MFPGLSTTRKDICHRWCTYWFHGKLITGQSTELGTGRADANMPFLEFVAKFKGVDKETNPELAAQRLINSKQGRKSVADFSIDFRILSVESGWEEQAFRGVFLYFPNDDLKYELVTRDLPTSLDGVISQCIHLDEHMRERRWPCDYCSQHAPCHSLPVAGRATPEEDSRGAADATGMGLLVSGRAREKNGCG